MSVDANFCVIYGFVLTNDELQEFSELIENSENFYYDDFVNDTIKHDLVKHDCYCGDYLVFGVELAYLTQYDANFEKVSFDNLENLKEKWIEKYQTLFPNLFKIHENKKWEIISFVHAT